MVLIEMSSSFAMLERTYTCACGFVRFALVNLIIFFMPDSGENILQYEIYVLHVFCIRLRINLHYFFSFYRGYFLIIEKQIFLFNLKIYSLKRKNKLINRDKIILILMILKIHSQRAFFFSTYFYTIKNILYKIFY